MTCVVGLWDISCERLNEIRLARFLFKGRSDCVETAGGSGDLPKRRGKKSGQGKSNCHGGRGGAQGGGNMCAQCGRSTCPDVPAVAKARLSPLARECLEGPGRRHSVRGRHWRFRHRHHDALAEEPR